MKSVLMGLILSSLLPLAARAQCNQAPQEPITHVHVPGHPFSAIFSRDGCDLFLSLPGARLSHLLIVGRDGAIRHDMEERGQLTGMGLSPDGRFLVAATDDGVAVFDTGKLEAGADQARIADGDDGPDAGSVYTAFAPDSNLLFVANEDSGSLSVYDTSSLPQSFKPLGRIPVGVAPVGLSFSADGKTLYSTSQIGPRSWSAKCTTEGPRHSEGILLAIDVAKARSDPRHAVLNGVAAGCNPVRVASSGGKLYVTARGDNAVLAFDASKLVTDAAHALLGKAAVGNSPVGVIVVADKVIVTNSARFGGGGNQTLSVLNAADLGAPPARIPAGGFPRELALSPDGGVLLVTNFDTRDLEMIDLHHLDQVEK